MNPRISKKERNLIKGALRRVFSRSELRQEALKKTRIEYTDPNRPRVTKWSECSKCKEKIPSYKIEVDHIVPSVPIDTPFELMSLDVYVDRLWCDAGNLEGLCELCHHTKSGLERKERARLRNLGKPPKERQVKKKSKNKK